jgi:hypothetical protein
MTELPMPSTPQPRGRQARTAEGRRQKIARQVERARLVRITMRRVDDDGHAFRSSLSLDRTVFSLASLIWGGDDVARSRLASQAEALWAADRKARLRAQEAGEVYRAGVSISRHVQATVMDAVIVYLEHLRTQQALPLGPPVKRPRPSLSR